MCTPNIVKHNSLASCVKVESTWSPWTVVVDCAHNCSIPNKIYERNCTHGKHGSSPCQEMTVAFESPCNNTCPSDEHCNMPQNQCFIPDTYLGTDSDVESLEKCLEACSSHVGMMACSHVTWDMPLSHCTKMNGVYDYGFCNSKISKAMDRVRQARKLSELSDS